MAMHNESVVILETEDNCVTDQEMTFPVQDVDQGLIRFRTHPMAEAKLWFKFTVDQGEAYLEKWEVSRSQWNRIEDLGVLRRVPLFIEGLLLHLNVIVVHNTVKYRNLPMYLPTGGGGMAFIVKEKAFAEFRDNYKERMEDWEVDVGKRLLFHTIVDKRCFPDLTLMDFANWPYYRVQQLIDNFEGQAPGHLWARNTAIESGLLTWLDTDEEDSDETETEVLLNDIKSVLKVSGEDEEKGEEEKVPVLKARLITTTDDEAEGDKEEESEAEKALGEFRFKPLKMVWQEGSPILTTPRRNDVDEGKAGTKRKRRTNKHLKKRDRMERDERAWRKRMGREQGMASSPASLSEEQEKWLIKLLVKCVEPSASEETLKFNEEHRIDENGMLVSRFSRSYIDDPPREVITAKGEGWSGTAVFGPGPGTGNKTPETPGTFVFGSKSGTGPGGWVLSRSDKKDIQNLKKNNQGKSPGQNVSMTMTASSVESPRGEISPMGNYISGEKLLTEDKDSTLGSGPSGKKVRVSVSSDIFEMDSPSKSPFLVKVGDTPRVVTVSSSSSSGGSEGVLRRLSLGEMFSGRYFTFPENGIVNSPRIEITTEEECEERTEEGASGGQ